MDLTMRELSPILFSILKLPRPPGARKIVKRYSSCLHILAASLAQSPNHSLPLEKKKQKPVEEADPPGQTVKALFKTSSSGKYSSHYE